MTQYYTYSKFISCTDLVDFQRASSAHHKMTLAWNVPDTAAYKYDTVEIYRYIGTYMDCVDTSTLTENSSGSALLCTLSQNFNPNGNYDGTVTQTQHLPQITVSTLSKNITGQYSFVDDFSALSDSSQDLYYTHLNGRELVSTNKTIISDIGFTRRCIYYIIKIYIKGVIDAAPYVLTPDYVSRKFSSHSTKSQIKHNYLMYEGDEIWCAFEADASNPALYNASHTSKIDTDMGLSRTANDISRLFQDSRQGGPDGLGGYGWVSDRITGNVFQHSLKNGALMKTFTTQSSPSTVPCRGFGIGVESETGSCIAVPGSKLYYGGTMPTVFRCDHVSTDATNIKANATKLFEFTDARKSSGYGVVPLYGYPNKMLVTDQSKWGQAAVLELTPTTAIPTYTANSSGYLGGYSAASCPNGLGIQKGVQGFIDKVILINPTNANDYAFSINRAGQLYSYSIYPNTGRIAIDAYNMFPNIMANTRSGVSAPRDYFSILAGNEYGVYIPLSATSQSQCVVNWAILYDPGLFIDIAATCGFDGENNGWIVRLGTPHSYKTKIYRTASDRTDTGDEKTIYPFGGESRYPSTILSDWPFSFTNTREIEWFLTRNHGTSSFNLASSVLGSTAQRELDPPSLDNTTVVTDWDGNGSNQTAYQAWWSCVDERMLRKHFTFGYAAGPQTATGPNANIPYFKVYKSDGTADKNIQKWGMRMSLSAVQASSTTLSSMEPDKFYETQSGVWLQPIVRKIGKWSTAFADTNTAYPSVSSRTQLIQNNLSGIKVQPHYAFSSSATIDYAINTNYSANLRSQVVKYATGLRYYPMANFVAENIYMYSDFTGNILVGSVATSPLNRDIIHPDTTDPVLSLMVSGYQSNPGYQDSPQNCYPWKNTSPVSMAARYASVSGYDDFTATYQVSTYMGSYLVTSVSLSTDDYMPSYLTDVSNTAVVTTTKNQIYNSLNVYDNKSFITYTYHSPSMNGLYYLPSGNPSVFQHHVPAYNKPNGAFNVTAGVDVINLYEPTMTGCAIVSSNAHASVAVLERWPEPKFYVQGIDEPAVRQNKFCQASWGYPGRYDKAAFLTKESNATDAKRFDTTYAVDPLSANLLDRSIARTWPISSWNVTVSTNNFRLGWTANQTQFVANASSTLNAPQDQQNLFDQISGAIFRYGDYALTMNVQASTTATSSDKPFIQYIKVAEFEPFANFWAISGSTVSPYYSSTNASITAQLAPISPIHNGSLTTIDGTYAFVSGYAPNLTVYFQESSEAHTFPISSYHWNFGDPFNEGPDDIQDINSNYYTISTVQINSGTFDSGCWNTNTQAHTAKHLYIMPGTYSVTLTVEASSTGTSDVCARYVNTSNNVEKFYVYVEEIPPRCNGGVYGSLSATSNFTNASSGVSGMSPVTTYFMASSIIAGSFPICRIDWDFGDGTIEKIMRSPLTTVTSQGLVVNNISAYTYDLGDPRNVVVPHIYTNKTDSDQTFNISMSAYACNTNTMVQCSAANLVVINHELPPITGNTRKLIGSRFDTHGNLIYLLEEQSKNTTYTVVLTGEL